MCGRKENKENREDFLCDKSQLCSDHPHSAIPTKVVMLGGVQDAVNYAKFDQNPLKRFGSLGVEVCILYYTVSYT